MHRVLTIIMCALVGLVACGPIETDEETLPDDVCCVDPSEPHIPQCPDDPTPPACVEPSSVDDLDDYGPDPLPW